MTIQDDIMREPLALSETDSKTQAVSMAIEEFIRRCRLQQLRAFRGKIDILSNDEIEAAELEDLQRFDAGVLETQRADHPR